jgi:hypothetical protein
MPPVTQRRAVVLSIAFALAVTGFALAFYQSGRESGEEPVFVSVTETATP